jgi:hypothetical protein
MPASAATPMSYFDGPVVGQIKIVPVFWSSQVNAELSANIPQFFQDAVNSSWYSALSEYSTAGQSGGTNQFIMRGTAVAGITLTPSRCATGSNCTETDAQIQTELAAQITAGHLPANNGNIVYVLFFPPNVTVTFEGLTGGTQGGFCTYHNTGVRPARLSSTPSISTCSPGAVRLAAVVIRPLWRLRRKMRPPSSLIR